jgi:hypothetical protein
MSVGQTMLWEGDGKKGEGSKVPCDRQKRQSEDLWEGNEQTVKGELGEKIRGRRRGMTGGRSHERTSNSFPSDGRDRGV